MAVSRQSIDSAPYLILSKDQLYIPTISTHHIVLFNLTRHTDLRSAIESITYHILYQDLDIYHIEILYTGGIGRALEVYDQPSPIYLFSVKKMI